MRILAAILLSLGAILELLNIFSLFTTEFDKTQGNSYLWGQYLFHIVLGVAGVILIIVGIIIIRNQNKKQTS